jgi:hypothetical protein
MDKSAWNQIAWLSQQFAGAQVTGGQIEAIGIAPDGPIIPAHTVSVKAVSEEWLEWSLVGLHDGAPVMQFVKQDTDNQQLICLSHMEESRSAFGSINRSRITVVSTRSKAEPSGEKIHYIGHDHHRPVSFRGKFGFGLGNNDEQAVLVYDVPILSNKALSAYHVHADTGMVLCSNSVKDTYCDMCIFWLDTSTRERTNITTLHLSPHYENIVMTKLGLIGVRSVSVTNSHRKILEAISEQGSRKVFASTDINRVAFNRNPQGPVMISQYGNEVTLHRDAQQSYGSFVLPQRYAIGQTFQTFEQKGVKRVFIEAERPHKKVGVVVDYKLLPGAFDAITAPFEKRGNWYYWAQSERFLLKLKIPPVNS